VVEITHDDGFCFSVQCEIQKEIDRQTTETTADDDAEQSDGEAFAMGIKGLTGLLQDNAPGCVREQKFESYLDRKVAIDASMHIYQFMVRTRDELEVEVEGCEAWSRERD